MLPAACIFFIGFFEGAAGAEPADRLPPPIGVCDDGRRGDVDDADPHVVAAARTVRGGGVVSRRGDGAAALAVNAVAGLAGALRAGAGADRRRSCGSAPPKGRAACCAISTRTGSARGVIVTTLARFFSFASLEISRFIGTDGAKRLEFFQRHLWLAPLAVAVALVGFVHPVWMLVDACRPSRQWPASLPRTRWRTLRRTAAAACCSSTPATGS